MIRNETYHGRFRGNVQQVELVLLGELWGTTDRDIRALTLYNADTLDVVNLFETEVDLVRQRYPAEYVSIPILVTAYVGLNPARPPFDDLRVRLAFALAIDQERFGHEVWKNLFTPAHGGFIPPGIPGHSAGIGLAYDPTLARRLLAEAGYPEGHHFPRIKGMGGTEAEIENLQRQWRENLGVEIDWEELDFATVLERLSTEFPSLYILGFSADYPDPDNFLRLFFQQTYPFKWRNEAYERFVEEAKRLTDQDKRLNLYRQADLILVEDVPLIPLLYLRQHFLVKPWVRNYLKSPTGTEFWKDVLIEAHDDVRQADGAYGEGFALHQPATLPPAPHPLRTTAEGEPLTLDPTLARETTSGIIIGQLFSGLVAESQELEIVPDIAQRWEILEDGRKYIFHLRPDVTWSDGRPVTAADFEYAWKRALNPATGAAEANLLYDVKGARAFHQGQFANPDSVGVSTADEHTLVVELEGPTGYFLNLLASQITFPMPQHVVEAYGEAWTEVEHIVTNGPFKLEAWKKGEVMLLARNGAYHGRFGGNVERVEVLFNANDLATDLAWYEAGRLDIARMPPLTEQQARQQHAGEYVTRPVLRTFYLDFDMSRPPFADPRVRRAFILATDRSRIPHNLMENYGSPATGGFCPPGMPGHSADIGLPYDPAQARQLLAEAGYPEGRNFPEIDWLIAEFLEPLTGYLQEQWQKNLGIHLFKKRSAPWGIVQKKRQQEPPALLLSGWVADYPDPDNFLRVCLQQQRLPGWQNETYDRLVEQAGRITDQHQRLKLYRQADKILIEEAVLMPLTYGRMPMLVKPWVKQHVHQPHRSVFWQDVIIEPH